MEEKEREKGLTRRSFMKAAGVGGMVAAGLDAGTAQGASEKEESKAASVPRRKLGKTGVEVSTLCLGGMFDTINNQLLLRQAHNWGVTFWDTAEAYGNGLSEEGFGRYFARNPEARKDIFLVTKLKGAPPDKMSEGFDRCLKRLHTDYVDMFFVHGIASLDEIDGSLRRWAADMKKSGRMKFFGFSTHNNMEDCLLAAAKVDTIDAVMFTYNFRLMQTDKMKEALDACTKAGTGLVAFKTQGGGPVKTDSEAELKMAGRFLERGFTDKQAKLKAVWENPAIASICSQMPNLTILSANVAAARDLTKLTHDDMDLFQKFAAETCRGYCAGCGSICLAAVDGAVPVSDVMRSLMYYRDYGDRDLARKVFAGLPEDVRDLLTRVDYSKAEDACPQGLAIAKLIREASQLLA